MSETITLPAIVEAIREELTNITTLRDATLGRSRTLIRSCALSIRAIHRHDWAEAETLLAQARQDAAEMVAAIAAHPMLYHTGYTQDALKEVVEAHLVFAVVRGTPLPTPAELLVTGPTYRDGMSEAATELRRFGLGRVRPRQVTAAEPFLDFLYEVYSHLSTADFPDPRQALGDN